MSKKLHNPKSYAPAVYIPCWLIQVSSKLLSHGAKLLYGRLSQWANENGQVFRSVNNLSQEIGVSYRSIEDYIKELKDCGLIGTYRNVEGGVNHFRFYEHTWMYDPIKEQLVYKTEKIPPTSECGTPPQDSVVPPTGFCGTPPQDSVVINIKEIERNKRNNIPADAVDKKSFFLTKEDMLKDNPHNIDEKLIEEWAAIRKQMRKPITITAWEMLNNVMTRLVKDGLNAKECFKTMIGNTWQSIQYRYFEQEINKPKLKYPTAEERAVNEKAIKERELNAIREKQIEIEASKNFNFILDEVKSRITNESGYKQEPEPIIKKPLQIPKGLLDLKKSMGIL